MDVKQAGPIDPTAASAGLRQVRISFNHDAEAPEDEIAKALAPVLGKGRVVHYALVRRGLAWKKKNWNVMAASRRRKATIKVRDVKASQLRSLLAAVATVEGARDLRLRGRRD